MPKKRKVKEVRRTQPNGEVISYGHLMVGYINGIAVLANREALMLLGIKLSVNKPPEWFYQHECLTVSRNPHVSFRVFVVNKTAMSRLGQTLSMKDLLVERRDTTTLEVSRVWLRGELTFSDGTPDAEEPKIQHIQTRQRIKHVGGVKKLWLLVKRLFSKGEVNYEHH